MDGGEFPDKAQEIDMPAAELADAGDIEVSVALPGGVAAGDIGATVLKATGDDAGFGAPAGAARAGAESPGNGASDNAKQPDITSDQWWREVDDYQADAGNGNASLPPEDPPGYGDANDDSPDPEDEIERRAAQVETANLIGHLGRFTHGPDSFPLKAEDDDTTLSISILAAGERAEESGLTPKTVIGRKAITDRQLEDLNFDAAFEAETLDEEVIPLVAELDQRTGREVTPIAHFTITVEPLGGRTAAADSEFDVKARPTAGVTLWVNKNLQTDAYVDADAMDSERGARVETFLSRLGFGGMEVPTPDQALVDDHYFQNLHSDTLRQINRFVRDQL